MRDTFCKLLSGLAFTSLLLMPVQASITVLYHSYNGDGKTDFQNISSAPLSTNALFMAYYSTNASGAGFNAANPSAPLYGDQLLGAYPLTQTTPTNFPGYPGQISGYLAEFYTNAPGGNLYLAVFDCTYAAYAASNIVPEGAHYLLTTNAMVPGVESSDGGQLTDVGQAINDYVASHGAWAANRVITYSNYASIALSTQHLTFASSYPATSSIAPGSYVLSNTGGSLMHYTNEVTYEAGASNWMVLTPALGQLAAGASVGQTCQVSVGELNAGTYTATVSVVSADADNSPQALTVTFAISRADQSIHFPPIGQQYITNKVTLNATADSGLPVVYSIAAGPGHLVGLQQLSFTATGVVQVTAAQAGNSNWNAAVTVTQSVVVVAPPPVGSLVGTLQPSFVSTNGGAWRIKGSSTWRNSGYTQGNLSPGGYGVEFKTLKGWITPAVKSVNVLAGQEAQVVGDYEKRPSPNDFDRDGLSDIGCYDPALGAWYVFKSFLQTLWTTTYTGGSGSLPVTGDFDGDGYCDYGTYTPASGYWRIMRSSAGEWTNHFGFAGTLPVTGDFDGDAILDFGCYYPPSGGWYIYKSQDGLWTNNFGFEGTVPVTGDFDGDGIGDFGCYYPPSGGWYIYKSQDGLWTNNFGFEGTVPITGDFDGDGIDDFGCYYPPNGGWYLYKSRDGFWENNFGFEGTVPITGDYDGDGIDDFGCYYPPTGGWYIYKSREGFWQNNFGYKGTLPLK